MINDLLKCNYVISTLRKIYSLIHIKLEIRIMEIYFLKKRYLLQINDRTLRSGVFLLHHALHSHGSPLGVGCMATCNTCWNCIRHETIDVTQTHVCPRGSRPAVTLSTNYIYFIFWLRVFTSRSSAPFRSAWWWNGKLHGGVRRDFTGTVCI